MSSATRTVFALGAVSGHADVEVPRDVSECDLKSVSVALQNLSGSRYNPEQMATCPECDAEIEVDEYDVDKGDLLSCPECGSNLEVTGLSPIELDVAGDEDDDDDDEDEEDEKTATRTSSTSTRTRIPRRKRTGTSDP